MNPLFKYNNTNKLISFHHPFSAPIIENIKTTQPVEVLFEGLDLTKYNKKPQNSGLLKDIHEDFCFLF